MNTPPVRRRPGKSIWLPGALLIYFAIISIRHAPIWIDAGLLWRFVATAVGEVLIVVALFFALRRREKLKRQREELDREYERINTKEEQ